MLSLWCGHVLAVQHRNRRQAAIEQQQEFQGLAASTKRQVGNPFLQYYALVGLCFGPPYTSPLLLTWLPKLPLSGSYTLVACNGSTTMTDAQDEHQSPPQDG